jgi:hypothetical protein
MTTNLIIYIDNFSKNDNLILLENNIKLSSDNSTVFTIVNNGLNDVFESSIFLRNKYFIDERVVDWKEYSERYSVQDTNIKLFYLTEGRSNGKFIKFSGEILVGYTNLSENNMLGNFKDIKFTNIKTINNIKDINNQINNVVHLYYNFLNIETYINNISECFNRYNHIKIKILSSDQFVINDKFHTIFDINKYLKESKIQLIIIHNILHSNESYYLDLEVSNKILDLNINKIFYIHDNNFIYSDEIVEKENLNFRINIKENLDFLKSTIHKFNCVLFNSKTIYEKFNKYVHLNNYIILNNLPTFEIYNNRIYKQITDQNINVCIVQNYLDESNMVSNSIMKIFGYDTRFSFKKLEKFEEMEKCKIDFYLFPSRNVEIIDLSIALKSGLPIIYNNKGNYDILKEYNNCYSFSDEELFKIYKDFNDIVFKMFKIGSLQKEFNYKLNMNIPELSPYLRCDDYVNWDISEIKENLNNRSIRSNRSNRNVCFIDFENEEGEKSGIIEKQIIEIKESGLYDKLDYIFILMFGKTKYLTQDYKIKLIYYSENINVKISERIIKYFSNQVDENVNILYINNKQNYETRKYLEYFLIKNHKICLESLKDYSSVGMNKNIFKDKDKWMNSYLGNFWWSKSIYLRNISGDFKSMFYSDLNNNKNNNNRFLSLQNNDTSLISSEEYMFDKIKINEIRPIYGFYFICCIGNYLDVVKDQIYKLINSKLYEKSNKIYCFVCKITPQILELLYKYNKFIIIATSENLYEKYAINNINTYLQGSYYLYYIHSKSVTHTNKCYNDCRKLCDYFTIIKWENNLKLLSNFDCVGINLRIFPKMHFSGNYWWTKSEHIAKLLLPISNNYLAPEMFICSNNLTKYVSIHQSYTKHFNTEYPESKYVDKEDFITIIPDYNLYDINCYEICERSIKK